MPFPSYVGKHAEDALVTPERFLEYRRSRGDLEPAPRDIVLLFQDGLMAHVDRTWEVERAAGSNLRRLGDDLGILGGFGIGAPVAAIMAEEMIARGTQRIVIVGTAGTLQPGIAIGDLVLATGAIRDEGVSHHYLHGDEPVEPSADLTEALADAFSMASLPFQRGSTWTIDAPYRETIMEVRHYQALGVLTVEMEAAALFAVAHVRRIEAAAVFAISDSLAALRWDPQFDSERTRATQVGALAAVFAALGHHPVPSADA
jgi:uridine phosphorylase